MAEKIIVTGGRGFIGTALCNSLEKTGHNIISLDIVNGIHRNILNDQCRIVYKDVDTVFHLAALTSLAECQSNPKLAYDTNVTGTVNVLEAARLNDVRKVVFASSSAVYEGNQIFPSREEMKLHPKLVYPCTKVAAEQACKAYMETYGMDITILRYCNVYGGGANIVRQSPPLFIYIIRELLNDRRPKLFSDGKQTRDYVYIDDVVDITKLVAKHKNAKNQVFNVTSEEKLSVNKIYELIATSLCKQHIKSIYRYTLDYWKGYKNLYKGKKIMPDIIFNEVNKYCNSSGLKLQYSLQWKPKTHFPKGIVNTIKEYKEKWNL